MPGVKVTPQPLADYSVSDAPGTTLSYLGYEFEVPWNANFTRKGLTDKGLVSFQFESGQSVTFIVPADQTGLLGELTHDKSMPTQYFQVVFRDLVNRSPYDQEAALLSVTPSTIRAFGPRAEAIRGVTLLTLKAFSSASGLESGVFTFEFPGKRGFQIGDPRKARSTELQIYDMNGRHVEIFCSTAKDAFKLSQPELNRILKTFHCFSVDSLAPSPKNNSALPN